MRRLLLAGAMLLLACHGRDALLPNREPETTLANVPLANTAQNPYRAVLRLSWNGSDPDGYVVGYEYRWTTYHLVAGDSLVNPWRFTTKADSVFAFESSDSVNLQVFMVRAVDNEGAVDPTPASRAFYTARVEPPQTTIVDPADGSVHYMLRQRTDTWNGLTITFQGEDTDGEVVDFSWRVDQRDWSPWNPATYVTLYAEHFPEPLAGSHTFWVKARDNTMVEDPTPAVLTFSLVIPTFERALLVVDETRDGTGAPESPTDQEVDLFYQEILAARTPHEWDVARQGVPPKEELGRYRVVLWHTDDMTPEVAAAVPELASYLNAGGRLILGGWRILTALSGSTSSFTFTEGFALTHLHLASMNHVSGTMWRGGIGTGPWAAFTVRPDTTKLRSTRRGNLPEVDTVEPSSPFCEPVLLFDHLREDTTYHLKPCATLYRGTTYDVAFFGFPLFFTQKDHMQPVLDDILRRMGE